jgi:tripartite-type tricarboxylate transporter receptor subunit TctC
MSGSLRRTFASRTMAEDRKISAALATPEVSARLRAIGFLPMPMSPAQIAELAAGSEQSWAQVIKAMGIKPQ